MKFFIFSNVGVNVGKVIKCQIEKLCGFLCSETQ